MLDSKKLRRDPSSCQELLQRKDPQIQLLPILQHEKRVREHKTELEQLQARQNEASKKIGEKRRQKQDITIFLKDLEKLADQISLLQKIVSTEEAKLQKTFLQLPNLPFADIPIGRDALDNVCIKEYGQKRYFPFAFKNHMQLNDSLQLFDFARAAKTTGSHWPLYTDLGARLEWALLNYMLDIHKKNGFIQIIPPLLVREEIMRGSGQLPKFREQLFHVKDDDFSLFLIPTAEVVLNGIHYEEIIEEERLPLLYTAYTPCFRREAGAAGAQERGLIRMHQFNKVELFSITTPDNSNEIFEKMVASAEEVLQGLDLHYRNMLLVTGDMSFAAAKTVDIEVWLPGQDRYYEVSSVSHCTDFQARRSKIRSRKKQEKPTMVHTLNGSGVATSRLMIALLENHQQEDKTVRIPTALQHYLGNDLTKIEPKA
jgi:seryl-tRNA synthetase